MTVAQVKHVPRAGDGRNTRVHGCWLWEEEGRSAGTPTFSVTPLCTRENKVFGMLCSDLVGRLYKECLKKK